MYTMIEPKIKPEAPNDYERSAQGSGAAHHPRFLASAVLASSILQPSCANALRITSPAFRWFSNDYNLIHSRLNSVCYIPLRLTNC